MSGGVNHTHFRKGKKVVVILRDGRKFMGKYVERRRRTVIIENHKPFRVDDIRTIIFYRPDNPDFPNESNGSQN